MSDTDFSTPIEVQGQAWEGEHEIGSNENVSTQDASAENAFADHADVEGAVVSAVSSQVGSSSSVDAHVNALTSVGSDAQSPQSQDDSDGDELHDSDGPAQSPIENEPDTLLSDSDATWYVRPPSGGQYGPATGDVLRGWIREGRVAKNSLLWRDGWPQWREAYEALPEFAETLPGSSSAQVEDVFADLSNPPNQSNALTQTNVSKTTPLSRSKTRPVGERLSGDSKVGSLRSRRATRRLMLVAVLGTLVVGLIITLVLVAGAGGTEQ